MCYYDDTFNCQPELEKRKKFECIQSNYYLWRSSSVDVETNGGRLLIAVSPIININQQLFKTREQLHFAEDVYHLWRSRRRKGSNPKRDNQTPVWLTRREQGLSSTRREWQREFKLENVTRTFFKLPGSGTFTSWSWSRGKTKDGGTDNAGTEALVSPATKILGDAVDPSTGPRVSPLILVAANLLPVLDHVPWSLFEDGWLVSRSILMVVWQSSHRN